MDVIDKILVGVCYFAILAYQVIDTTTYLKSKGFCPENYQRITATALVGFCIFIGYDHPIICFALVGYGFLLHKLSSEYENSET